MFCRGGKSHRQRCYRNNVLIGAGAVVAKDIPDNAVAVGVPAKVISYDGKLKSNIITFVVNKAIFHHYGNV